MANKWNHPRLLVIILSIMAISCYVLFSENTSWFEINLLTHVGSMATAEGKQVEHWKWRRHVTTCSRRVDLVEPNASSERADQKQHRRQLEAVYGFDLLVTESAGLCCFFNANDFFSYNKTLLLFFNIPSAPQIDFWRRPPFVPWLSLLSLS